MFVLILTLQPLGAIGRSGRHLFQGCHTPGTQVLHGHHYNPCTAVTMSYYTAHHQATTMQHSVVVETVSKSPTMI